MGNKGHKYKSIIAPLLSSKRIGRGIPRTVTLRGKIPLDGQKLSVLL